MKSVIDLLVEDDASSNKQLKAWAADERAINAETAYEELVWKAAGNLVAAHGIAGGEWEVDEAEFGRRVEELVPPRLDADLGGTARRRDHRGHGRLVGGCVLLRGRELQRQAPLDGL